MFAAVPLLALPVLIYNLICLTLSGAFKACLLYTSDAADE